MESQGPDGAARLRARAADGRRPQSMHHRWETLLFLHWRLPADRIQATLPPGLTVDTYNGEAYLAIVPFFMRNVRPARLPSVPWISNFLELNVRTYVYDRDGVPGVWFYSLDCNQPVAVIVARVMTGLPYMHASMSARQGRLLDYTCRRRGSRETARYRYRAMGEAREAAPESLEFFLLERYYLFSQRSGALVRAQVTHVPYRFREAEVEECSTLPVQMDGFPEVSVAPVHVCAVDGFDVRTYGIEKIGWIGKTQR